MFDKSKKQFEKFQEDHEAVRNAVKHVKKYQVVYVSLGASAITAIVMKSTIKPQIVEVVNTVAPVVAPVFNNMPVFNNENILNNGGYARKIIRCIETDEMWPSMSKAADAAGHSLQRLSDQIHGRTDHLDGLHYVIEGVTAN